MKKGYEFYYNVPGPRGTWSMYRVRMWVLKDSMLGLDTKGSG